MHCCLAVAGDILAPIVGVRTPPTVRVRFRLLGLEGLNSTGLAHLEHPKDLWHGQSVGGMYISWRRYSEKRRGDNHKRGGQPSFRLTIRDSHDGGTGEVADAQGALSEPLAGQSPGRHGAHPKPSQPAKPAFRTDLGRILIPFHVDSSLNWPPCRSRPRRDSPRSGEGTVTRRQVAGPNQGTQRQRRQRSRPRPTTDVSFQLFRWYFRQV